MNNYFNNGRYPLLDNCKIITELQHQRNSNFLISYNFLCGPLRGNVIRPAVTPQSQPSAWVYNWGILFLGEINAGTRPWRLEESQIWESKIWSRGSRYSNLRKTALARSSSHCKLQSRHLCCWNVSHQQIFHCLNIIKGMEILLRTPVGSLTPS
jgi:hypothetical protein